MVLIANEAALLFELVDAITVLAVNAVVAVVISKQNQSDISYY